MCGNTSQLLELVLALDIGPLVFMCIHVLMFCCFKSNVIKFYILFIVFHNKYLNFTLVYLTVLSGLNPMCSDRAEYLQYLHFVLVHVSQGQSGINFISTALIHTKH